LLVFLNFPFFEEFGIDVVEVGLDPDFALLMGILYFLVAALVEGGVERETGVVLQVVEVKGVFV
jgi:hypothetical protein